MNFDAVFIYLNIINGRLSGAEYQLDCSYIRSYLSKSGLHTLQYINKHVKKIGEMIKELQNIQASSYIFFINEYNYYISRLLVNNLKVNNPSFSISIIGPSVKYISKNLASDILADIFILDGEAFSLNEILHQNMPFEKINNIAYRNRDQIFFTDEYLPDYSLDDLGLPYHDGIVPPEEVQNVGMISSVGCYGACSFCSYNDSKHKSKSHSLEYVIQELEYLKYYLQGDTVTIRFLDDCFSLSNTRTQQLCEKILEKNLNFQFWCCTRADLLSKELLDLMSKCNFKDIVIGLETASIDIMRRLGKIVKTDTPENYLHHLKDMFLYALNKRLNPFMSINFGLPFEQYSDALETIKFIKDNFAVNNTSVCFMTCFPGSKVFEDSHQYLVTKEISPTKLPFRTYYPNYDMRRLYHDLIESRIINEQLFQILTMTNDYIDEFKSFYTGIYESMDLHGSIKHILIKDSYENCMDFIDKNVDINGIVITSAEQLEVSKKNLFSDDRKRLKLAIQAYDKHLAAAFAGNKYLPNQVFTKDIGEYTVIQPDNVYRKTPIRLQLTKIKNESDLNELLHRAESFFTTGTITMNELNDGAIIENVCSFSGECTIHAIPRVVIEKGDISACLGRGKIGNVSDTYQNLINNVASLLNDREKMRNCGNCKAKDWCSKCIFPPEFLSENRFCVFMNSHPDLGLYLKVVHYLSKLDFVIHSPENIKVFPALRYNTKQNAESTNSFVFRKEVILFELGKDFMIASLKTKKILKCNEAEKNIAFHLLGLQKLKPNLDPNKIIHKLGAYGLLVGF